MFPRIASLSCKIVNLLPYPVSEFLGRKGIHNERWVRYGDEIYTEVTILGFHVGLIGEYHALNK
jgi:hypothetical protein